MTFVLPGDACFAAWMASRKGCTIINMPGPPP
ncbi:Uncharacterised protein [Vibrio cholerae]|nr:Uncharacterised protein [Vibrio cholerae]